jgi:hypothetical protein
MLTVIDVLAASIAAYEQNGNRLLTRSNSRKNKQQSNARRVHRILASVNRDSIIEPYREQAQELRATLSGIAMAALSRSELSVLESCIVRAAQMDTICPDTQKSAIDALVAGPEIQYTQRVNREWYEVERAHAAQLPWDRIAQHQCTAGIWGDEIWPQLTYQCLTTGDSATVQCNRNIDVEATIGLMVRLANDRMLIGAVPTDANWAIKSRMFSNQRNLNDVNIGDRVRINGFVGSVDASRANSGVAWVHIDSISKVN